MNSTPRILLVAFESWTAIARLPRALQDAGFEVGIACRADAYLAHTRYRDRLFLLPEENRGSVILSRLEDIISEWPPALIIPGDDRTVMFLTRVYEMFADRNSHRTLAELLKRSLGNPLALREALSKRLTLERARQLGIRVPINEVVTTQERITAFAAKHDFPVVLKRSFSFGGSEVFICRTQSEILRAWKHLQRERRFKRRFKRWREGIRGRRLQAHWLPEDSSITVNQFIAGKTAMTLTAAFEGQSLGVVSAVKEQSFPDSKGPSSVVRFFCNQEMEWMTKTLTSFWKLTGFIGFDFMIDAKKRPWLLECNPRPTSISHLGAKVGMDLCRALYRQLTHQPALPCPELFNEFIVAHFPQEHWRDPNSSYLTSAFHDVPWDDAGLLKRIEQSHPQKRA